MPNKKVGSKNKGKEILEEEPTSLRYNALHPTCVIAEEDILETAVVGQGFYATVKFGLWTRPNKKKEKVAIKCIKEKMVRDHLAEILTEANNMVKLEHDNVVKLYGICLVARDDEPCKVKLVTEYAPFGSLLSVIQDKEEEYRNFFCQIAKLWEFAYQIAHGMQYLHSKNMIHFDLASRNVLVITPNKVRISDFGLAKALCHDQKKILLEKPMAMAWCAPELFKKQLIGLATKGCDVWSYGVLLWELMSFGEKPWEGLSTQQIREQADNPHKRLCQPQACSNAVFGIMQECWSHEPGNRPSFTIIIDSLKKAKPMIWSAKNTYWTAKPRDLSFQQRTQITIIDRYGAGRYLCQNDKAEIGYIDAENIDFKAAPVEITLNKPKIGCPFDMRHTTKEAILNEHKATGMFPVKVENLLQLAEKSAPQNTASKQCSSPEQTVQASEIAVEEDYIPMDGQSKNIDDDNAPQKVKHDPFKHYSVPPPIPERDDLILSQRFNTLPTRKRTPVPIPRKNKSKSTTRNNNNNEQQDPRLEWVISVDKKEGAPRSNVKSEDEETFFPRHNDNMEERGADKDTYDEQTNDKEVDLINFDQESEQENLAKPPPLPDWSTSQGACNVPFPSLPSALVQTTAHERVDLEKDMPANQTEVNVGFLIDLPIDHDVENKNKNETRDDVAPPPVVQTPVPGTSRQSTNQPEIGEDFPIDQKKEETFYDDVPPPLPPKDILSRSEHPGPLPPPLVNPVPGTAGQWQTPTSIDPRTLTHPSSHNEYASSSERPVYWRPFPTALPRLPTTPQPGQSGNMAKSRSKSESSAEKETAYGEEINEGIIKIHSEFPDISKDACYARMLEYKGDINSILKVLQVSRLTNVSEKDANFHLGHCQWDIERTVNYILDKRQ